MTGGTVAGMILAGVLHLTGGALGWADPSPTPSPTAPSGGIPQGTTLPFTGETRDITFPVANLDGSMITDDKVITLRADVFFAYNRAALNAKAGAALDSAAARMRERAATRVRVDGHTDDQGTAAYNQRLSKRRAEAVRVALGKRLPGVRISIRAHGESRPVADNDTAKGRGLNRRVTITVTG